MRERCVLVLQEQRFTGGVPVMHRSPSGTGEQRSPGTGELTAARYKTELCRPFEERGVCRYGEKCQFAHGYRELRSLSRHPKYKTEPCRTFHSTGLCPYGPRCHFIHNADERRPGAHREIHRELNRPRLQHSPSCFSGSPPPSPELHSPGSPPRCTDCSSGGALSSRLHGNTAFFFPGQGLEALLAPLAVHAQHGYYGNGRDSAGDGYYGNGRDSAGSPVSCSSSGSDSPGRLPIFSRLSLSED